MSVSVVDRVGRCKISHIVHAEKKIYHQWKKTITEREYSC